jgi:hypothetical protein
MRFGIFRAGVCYNTVEASFDPRLPIGLRNPLRRLRAMYPDDDVIPIGDASACEPGCLAVVVLRWPADPGSPFPWVRRGRPRRIRWTRPAEGFETDDTYNDDDT